jgi:hypothetical protein
MKDHAELKIDYNPVWEEVKLLKATVTNGSQTKAVSNQEINFMDAGWVASAPRYPAAKTVVASLPAVEVGSVIEYEFERTKRDRPFFAATHIFRGFDPIDQETVKLTAPAALALQVLKDDNGVAVPDETTAPAVVAETTQRQNGKATWQWKVREQTPLKPEDSLPPMRANRLRITAGTAAVAAGAAALNEVARADRRRKRQRDRCWRKADRRLAAIRITVKNIRGAGPQPICL